MSLKTLAIVNCVSVVGVVVGLVAWAEFSGAFDTRVGQFVAPVVFVLALLGLVFTLRDLSKTRRGAVAPRRSVFGYGVILRLHHDTGPLGADEAAAWLARVSTKPESLGRVIEASKCRDCGHIEIVLQNTEHELARVTLGTAFVQRRHWLFGPFVSWRRDETIKPLADAEPVELPSR